MPSFALLFHFHLKLILFVSLFFPLLIDMTNRTRTSLQTFEPTQCQTKSPEKAVHLREGPALGQTLDFKKSSQSRTEANPAGDEAERPVETQKRGEKIIHVSHIVVLRRKGGRKPAKANGVPHPLGRSVGGYFLQSFTGSCIYFTYTGVLWTDCEPALCLSWFRLLSEGTGVHHLH